MPAGPGSDPAQWAAEAQQAARLTQPGSGRSPNSGDTGLPWYASPYRPALPLPAVLAAHGGPLPEPWSARSAARWPRPWPPPTSWASCTAACARRVCC
ncbi:hypothetical protein O1L55_12670 [Streptomyces albulus]|nr:hypothetical protein [Streptomyces noursei]